MNKIKLALLVSGALFTGSHAFAAGQTGEVNFTGQLTDETCEIFNGDDKLTVELPTLSTKALDQAGKEAGWKSFQIRVHNCSSGVKQVAANFESANAGSVDPKTGNLINTDTAGAKNVQVAIRYNDGRTGNVHISGPGEYFNVDAANTGLTGRSAILAYEGGYHATAQTTAGKVAAKVLYTLAYK